MAVRFTDRNKFPLGVVLKNAEKFEEWLNRDADIKTVSLDAALPSDLAGHATTNGSKSEELSKATEAGNMHPVVAERFNEEYRPETDG